MGLGGLDEAVLSFFGRRTTQAMLFGDSLASLKTKETYVVPPKQMKLQNRCPVEALKLSISWRCQLLTPNPKTVGSRGAWNPERWWVVLLEEGSPFSEIIVSKEVERICGGEKGKREIKVVFPSRSFAFLESCRPPPGTKLVLVPLHLPPSCRNIFKGKKKSGREDNLQGRYFIHNE